MDFAIDISGSEGRMTFSPAQDIRNNVYLSVVTQRGAFFQNPLFGSRLHLLHRAKNTDATARLAREYALEALQWLLDTGRASDVEVTVERDKTRDLCRLALQIGVAQANRKQISFKIFVEVV